jgi:UDPglucose 6-dehydrogenase
MSKTKIGVIGYGFVGKAVANSFADREDVKVRINDPAYPELSSSFDKIKEKSDAIFVCLPTPQDDHGECDTSILEGVLEKLLGYEGVVICKSTAPPVMYRHLENTLGLKLVHAPEFLTAANANYDYINPVNVVIGCKHKLWEEASKYILPYIQFAPANVEYCSIAEAAMFKYVANTMLAMKVIMNNEYASLCEKFNINWENVAGIASTDSRLGTSHWSVPGPDGQRGFGGACFPKDTSALLHLADEIDVDMSMLRTAITKNFELRSDLSKPNKTKKSNPKPTDVKLKPVSA